MLAPTSSCPVHVGYRILEEPTGLTAIESTLGGRAVNRLVIESTLSAAPGRAAEPTQRPRTPISALPFTRPWPRPPVGDQSLPPTPPPLYASALSPKTTRPRPV